MNSQRRRNVAVCAGVILAIFLALFANEILGQPPLMTASLRPDTSLAGDWHCAGSIGVDLVIHADGAVTGEIGGAPISAGRLTYGRSWFGRMLHINSTYRIIGAINGEPFSMPFEHTGAILDGALFRHNSPTRLTLSRYQP